MLNPDMDVLVVDGVAAMRRMVRGCLREMGLNNVREADDGSTALESLKKKKADLVVSCWNMPRMPGIDLLRAIRGDQALKDVPVLLVTAEAKRENIVEAVQAGVNNFVVKPFNAKTLEEKLTDIFK